MKEVKVEATLFFLQQTVSMKCFLSFWGLSHLPGSFVVMSSLKGQVFVEAFTKLCPTQDEQCWQYPWIPTVGA
jgi:hypothetical protein